MPATYRHVYTSEQIEGRHRFSWQKPEPAKPAEYRVFGITCDKRTFDKYNHRDYNLGDGVLRDLMGVELWATSTELAEHFPEFTAEANKIIARVRAEITGEEDKNMSKPRTAADFITHFRKSTMRAAPPTMPHRERWIRRKPPMILLVKQGKRSAVTIRLLKPRLTLPPEISRLQRMLSGMNTKI